MTTPSAAAEPAINLSPRAKLEILGAILLALFLFALDQTVVGVALPDHLTDLGGNDLYTWSVTIYLLTSTISGPIYGKLSDLFGRRPIIIFAVSLFLVASVLAGLSQEMWQFILFRGLQGLGGGAVFPIALAVVADLYTPAERGKYLGLFGAVFGLSSLVGPAIGGFITDNFSWHWIFFVNVPIGLISLFILWRLLPAIKHPEAAATSTTSAAALFTARDRAVPHRPHEQAQAANGRIRPVGGLILVGLVFGALFVWWRVARPGSDRPAALFRIRTFTHLGDGDVPGRLRVLRRGRLPAALVPDGRRGQRHGVRLQPPAAPLRADLQRHRIGADRRAHGPLQSLILGSLVILLAAGSGLLTNLHANTDRLVMWLWMAHHRAWHRAVVRGVHADRAERRFAATGSASRQAA